jgi:hypothetical protein
MIDGARLFIVTADRAGRQVRCRECGVVVPREGDVIGLDDAHHVEGCTIGEVLAGIPTPAVVRLPAPETTGRES